MGILFRVRSNTDHNTNMSGEFPVIKSTHSLVAKHVTKERWDKVKAIETKTCGFTLAKAIACAVEFDNQHCGIYAGDWDSYKDFSEIFDAIIQEYHGISADAKHTSDMDPEKIKGNIEPGVPVHSTRIRVGRNIDGFGLSPGITTTTPRPSCCGSTRRTRPASSPWRRAATSREFSPAWPAASPPSRSPSRPSPGRSTLCPSSTDTSTPAPPTSAPA